ncbi:MAG: hypothetical protein SNJ53_01155 [Thermodesulfovibrionales bacterium]
MEIDTVLWQEGVTFKVKVECSLRDLLTKQLDIPDDYIENRIAIIFLDGSPVDDIDRAIVKEGSCIALSAQMPGLVGAAMIRKGIIAPFRTAITHPVDHDRTASDNRFGLVKIKLFNALINELGGILQSKVNVG